jgi:hypothetical protein|tara:strand:- start:4828 stop:5571 length:744 start_codon:yes stop_codon:yes gene_type:complete
MTKKVKLKSESEVNIISVFGRDDGLEIEAIKSNRYIIKFGMYATLDDTDDVQGLSVDQNISYQRIQHFLKYYLHDSLWYDKYAVRTLENHFATTDNVFVVTPEVNITYLTNCLFAKFNSICKPNITVSNIAVVDLETNITYDYEDEDGDIPDFLPYQDEFMGELSIYDKVWWERDDISTYDNYAMDLEELEVIRDTLAKQKHLMDADFIMIEEEVRNQMTQAGFIPEGEVVEVDFKAKQKKWKPKFV